MNHSALVARWNATYPPGTPILVTLRDRSVKCHARDAALSNGIACLVAEDYPGIPIPIEQVEYRIVESGESIRASLALGIPPLEEMGDPEPLVNLRDIPRKQWPDYEHHWLVIPDAIAGYISKLHAPPTPEQEQHIEDCIGQFHHLPPWVWRDGEPWLQPEGDASSTKAEWFVSFTFDHRFIPGTASLHRI